MTDTNLPTFRTIAEAYDYVTANAAPVVIQDLTGLWHGYDTTGAPVEKLITADGRCFARHYGWNGYGKGWSKWENQPSVSVSRVVWGQYDHVFHVRPSPVVMWGFAKLTRGEIGRCRVPKTGAVCEVASWSDELA